LACGGTKKKNPERERKEGRATQPGEKKGSETKWKSFLCEHSVHNWEVTRGKNSTHQKVPTWGRVYLPLVRMESENWWNWGGGREIQKARKKKKRCRAMKESTGEDHCKNQRTYRAVKTKG